MANVRQKPPELLVNRRGGRGRGLVVAMPTDRSMPRFPLKDTQGRKRARDYWRHYWRSPVSAAVDLGADAEALRRWMEAIDEVDKLLPACQASPLMKGSMGQLVLNPLFRRLAELNRIIEGMEDRFGVTPRSRFRLQLTYTAASEGEERLRALRERRGRALPPGDEGEIIEARVVEL